MTKNEAIKTIEEGAGTHFDPELTKIFLTLVDQ
jgi:response regulator RpfG family c-di-GMP phosphodiesterase